MPFMLYVTVGDEGQSNICFVSPVYQPLKSTSIPCDLNLFNLLPLPTLPLIVCNPPFIILK